MLQDCGYLGDDIIDLLVLICVGFKVCVVNGYCEVKLCSDYVIQVSGGYGVVCEICDLVLVV